MTFPSISRRSGLAAMSAVLALGVAPRALAADADQIHRRVLTLDSHVDVVLPQTPPRADAADLARLRAGGVDAVVFAVFAPNGPDSPAGVASARAEAEAKLAAIKAFARDNPKDAALALSAADVRRIVGEGKVAVLIGFLNAYWLNGEVDAFDRLYADGVRVAGLVHAGNTVFADSSRPGPGEGAPNGGLSDRGKAAIRRLNDLGVLVDVSQLTPSGVSQVLAISRAPVVATHSNVRALVDNPRNLSDAQIDAIAAKGGVIQVTPFNSYLTPRPADYGPRLEALRRQYGLSAGERDQGIEALEPARRGDFMTAYRALLPRATVKQYVDHIDYIAKRVGADHVGIGTDFNHGAGITGFADEGEAPNVTRELVARGYTEAQIAQIWGGNFLRVLAAAEAARKR